MEILKRIPYFGSLALVAYMPFHIFLAQSISLFTGGLEVWKIGKDVLLILLVLFTICLVFWQGRASKFFKVLVGITVVYGALHLILWAVQPDLFSKTAMLGTVYNVRLLLFAVLGAGAVLLLPKFVFSSVLKIVLGVSTVVALLGVIQYFLPNDFLTHFGYSLERGVRPAFFIDDNPNFPRIMSTLREPNALGAYLILPLSALTLLFFRLTDKPRRLMVTGMWGIHALALLLTQSRSAWAGAFACVALTVLWHNRSWFREVIKRYWWLWVGLAVVVAGSLFAVRNTYFFQHYIVHSDPNESVQDLDSNDYHSLLVKQGLEGVKDQPLGHGPGTAGIVSIQNPDGGQLTENYYIQVAYEVGILGAALFIGCNIWLYIVLWRRRDYAALCLCASFWGYMITNMLLHTWSNEAVAAQWWILAGMLAASATQTLPAKVLAKKK